MEDNKEKQIFIVLTQTGTILSRILKLLTGAKYNHSSISLEEDLSYMYSFGRKNPYNPFIGGFVKESSTIGTFKRFSNTEALVLGVYVSNEKYQKMKVYLSQMYDNKTQYHYNYFGLFFAMFGIAFRKNKYYYCSEFVRNILARFNVVSATFSPDIVKPIDFLQITDSKKIYKGKLKNFNELISKNKSFDVTPMCKQHPLVNA